MKLIDVISNLESIDENNVLYVKKIEGEFRNNSECVLLMLTEVEQELKTHEIATRKCPGYDYFMEIFLIKEFGEGLVGFKSVEAKCERIIHYAVFDA